MAGYAESATCRRRQLLDYFGEAYEEENCGACDNCQSPRKTFDGTAVARKFLAALYRIREKSGFGVGVNHVADVLAGKNVEKVRRLEHDGLSAFGGGKEHTKNEWAAIGRQLLHQGQMRQAGEFRELEITPKGHETMVGRAEVALTALADSEAPERQRVERDDALFERLRALRKRLADERDVPAYVIFSDVALVQMARAYPASEAEFRRIIGVGEHKLREFGDAFTAEIRDYLRTNPRQTFPGGAVVAAPKIGESHRESLRLFRAGRAVDEIAVERGFVVGTILAHLGVAAEAGEEVDAGRFLSSEEQREVGEAFAKVGWANLTGVREALDNRHPYEVLRIYRAARQPRATAAGSASGQATPGRTPEYQPRSPGLAHAPA
jgi:ATP-dependent DNA helicase RecQ